MHGGSEAFDRWGRHLDSILKTAFPTTLIPDRQEVSQSELVDELLNVLIAVPSVNFVMDLVSTLKRLFKCPSPDCYCSIINQSQYTSMWLILY